LKLPVETIYGAAEFIPVPFCIGCMGGIIITSQSPDHKSFPGHYGRIRTFAAKQINGGLLREGVAIQTDENNIYKN
jgi:hypothetical protein